MPVGSPCALFLPARCRHVTSIAARGAAPIPYAGTLVRRILASPRRRTAPRHARTARGSPFDPRTPSLGGSSCVIGHVASLAITFVLAIAATLLAGCGGGASSGGVVNLTFWSFNPPIQKQVDLFNSTHPNIHVTYTTEPSGFGQYYPKILAAQRAGNAPDVALIEYQYVPTMVANGALVDISKYGANDAKSQFDPAAWALDSENGAQYGYPQDTGPMALFYNKSIFTKAGISHSPRHLGRLRRRRRARSTRSAPTTTSPPSRPTAPAGSRASSGRRARSGSRSTPPSRRGRSPSTAPPPRPSPTSGRACSTRA